MPKAQISSPSQMPWYRPNPFCFLLHNSKNLHNHPTDWPVSYFRFFLQISHLLISFDRYSAPPGVVGNLKLNENWNWTHASSVEWHLNPRTHFKDLPWVTWNQLKAFLWQCVLLTNLPFSSFSLSSFFFFPITLPALWHDTMKVFALALIKYLGHQQ